MRFELYEGPIAEFEDMYIDVIYYSTDNADEMVTKILEYVSTYYDSGTDADDVLTVYDRNAGKYMMPSEFMNMLLQESKN